MTALLSPARISPYLTACAGHQDKALSLYRWNSAIAAAFFEDLGHLEVILRNALDQRLVIRQQRRNRQQEWFDDPTVPLAPRARTDILEARRRASVTGASTPRGKIIAELNFGFWRFLIARQYRATLWPDLARAFPNAPGRALTLVEDPLKRLHKLRNRIAHHEAIWDQKLADRHDDVQNLLTYLDHNAAAWVASSSRIGTMLSQRP
ncbi:hypothetical protein [Streptomyces sp. E1N211]|uniref:hypothetical protein n=1 Tax=Streptomyces sp. E1N211 TaxID=1851876 RepID=UPI001F4DFF61|nr:hypothetical protein [Streptomyces sp. E1N211]